MEGFEDLERFEDLEEFLSKDRIARGSYCREFANENDFYTCFRILDLEENANEKIGMIRSSELLKKTSGLNDNNNFFKLYKLLIQCKEELHSEYNILHKPYLAEWDIPAEWVYDMLDIYYQPDIEHLTGYLQILFEEKNVQPDIRRLQRFVKKRGELTTNEKIYFRMVLTSKINIDYKLYPSHTHKFERLCETENVTECQVCGFFNIPSSISCYLCEISLPKMCGECRTVIEIDAQFCPSCGFKL